MFFEKTKVLWNQQVTADCLRIGLSCNAAYARARPGQFIMLRRAGQKTPLLNRPFSIHRLIRTAGAVSGIEVLYKVVGAFSAQMCKLKENDALFLLGPLGKGFHLTDVKSPFYFAAGGIGVAPIVFLIDYMQQKGIDLTGSRVFLGARSADDLLCREDIAHMGVSVHISTDDGTAGDQCLLTHPLETAAVQTPPGALFACGPMEMLACVAGIAHKLTLPCQVSIETMMACGMGACLGCAVKSAQDKDAYLHVCRNGPVFEARRLRFD